MGFDAPQTRSKSDEIASRLHHARQVFESGKAAEAIEICRAAVESDPTNADLWALFGTAFVALNRWDEAIPALREALRLTPDNLAVLNNLGIALAHVGQFGEAIDCFQQAIQIDQRHVANHDHLGTALVQAGRMGEAVPSFQTVCRLAPNHAEGHFKLGVTLEKLGRYAEAVEGFRRALVISPERVDIPRNLAMSLAELARFDEAVQILQQVLSRRPNYPEAFNALGVIRQKQGQLEAAATAFEQAISLKPDYARAFGNLRNAYRQLGKIEAAVAHCRHTIERHPNNPVAFNSLGTLLLLQEKMDEAQAAFQQAVRLKPNFAAAISNLGHVNRTPGQLDQSLDYYRQAMAIEPNDPSPHSNLFYVMHFHPGYDLQALSAEGARWRERFADPQKRFIRPHTNSKEPQRRLKIGYVSPNFYRQAECFFVVPLLEHHDRQRFEIHCYASVTRPDAMTSRLRTAADTWHDVLNLSNEALAEKIRADGIDILVDLTMHMGNKRLTMFARKPSPVQVTWLAYPGTTGLDTIDYRLTDAHMEPHGADDSWSSEQPWRLPDSWCCYEPVGEFPSVNHLPALSRGFVTFGSLNTPMKHHEAGLRLWATILAGIPQSRLMLLGPKGSWQEFVRSIFSTGGVSPDRIDFVRPCPWVDYLKLYHEIDICLDPLPYSGITTTCDALWMGVPVVSLVGNTPAGRAGLGLLRTVGLDELVATTDDEFVRIAKNFANDLPALAKLRSTLRNSMQASPLMDAPRFARNVEAAYRTMWRSWCDSATDSATS